MIVDARLRGWPVPLLQRMLTDASEQVLIPDGWNFHRWFDFQYKYNIPLERWGKSQRAALARIERLGTMRRGYGPTLEHSHPGWPSRRRPKGGKTALFKLARHGTVTDRVDPVAEAERLPRRWDRRIDRHSVHTFVLLWGWKLHASKGG